MATTAVDDEAEPTNFVRLTDEDRKQFDASVTINALKVPKQQAGRCIKLLAEHLYKQPGIRRVEACSDDASKRLVLLEEGLSRERFRECAVVPDGMGTTGKGSPACMTLEDFIRDNGFDVVPHVITRGYKDMSLQEVLKHYLPAGVEIPSSFESVGHIAHLNLKEAALPFKNIIGQVIIDKNPTIKTVVNKLGTITSEFRVFDMEVLAGEDVTVTEVKQHGLRFKLDFRRVYWNSRLEKEHSRLIDRWIDPSHVVVDAMCGIGPFAVPAAKQGCRVFANDLNPASYEWLLENCRINKVQDKVCCYNEDARAFLRRAAGGGLEYGPNDDADATDGAGSNRGRGVPFEHIIMNLPASAVEFLDALKGEFSTALWEGRELPLVHVYSFLQETEDYGDLRRKIEGHLGGSLDEDPQFCLVRDVAPKKAMICSTFRVPRHIAYGDKQERKRPRGQL